MRKTPKKVLGILGLFAVVSMTIFAATLPTTSASATGNVTDTIVIRVRSSSPWIDIEEPSNDAIISHPEQTITYEYIYLTKVTAQLTYTDDEGSHTVTLAEIDLSEESGGGEIPFDLSSYGYGDFTIKLIGDGDDGSPYEDTISISYYPVITTVEQDPTTEDVYANLDYDLDNPDIDTIVLNIYSEDDPEKLLWTTTVPRGTTKVELPFAEEGFLAGKYIITTTAYDAGGDSLYRPYTVGLDYTRKSEVPAEVPNTGLFTSGALNVSNTDFLVTGLIILFITSFSGIYFITHRRRGSRK